MDNDFGGESGRRPRRPFGHPALVAVALVVLGCAAILGGFSVAFHRAPWAIVSLAPPPQDLFHKQKLLVLVEGLDYDYNPKDEEYSTQSRSDVIMAVDLDFRTHQIYELSVPRDMDAVLPNGQEAKINQAQSDGGVHEAEGVIARWLGIPGFDRYVVLRINTAKDLINAIGGVAIDPKNSYALKGEGPNGPIDYDDSWGHLHIHFKPGLQSMNGDEAVSYSRFRHDWCGDPCRIMRQQQVMSAVVAKLKGDKVNTLLHLSDIIGVFNRDVQTNLSRTEELSLALAFDGLDKADFHTNQVPYVADKSLPYAGDVIIPDESAKAKLVNRMLLNPPGPTPSPDAGAVAAVATPSVRVDVENGTGIAGVAKRVAAILRAKGFTIVRVGNAGSDGIASTELHEHSAITYAGLRVREALGAAAEGVPVVVQTRTPDPASPAAKSSDVTVIIGSDLASALTENTAQKP